MDTVIAFLSLALFIAFIVGLIKPSLVRMPNRKRSSAVYLGGCLALGVIGSILWPTEKSQTVAKADVPEVKAEPTTPTFEYADKTLKEYRNEPKETRHDIVISPSPACVTISVLSRENNGAASDELLSIVRNALNGEDVRPVADRVTVQSAQIVDYQIRATLFIYPGPESEPIRAAAEAKLKAYASAQHRLGRDIRLSAIYAALHVEGVQRVELAAPVADIVLDKTQASFCTDYQIVIGGSDE